ncbi:hypothetical protein LADH09A_006105 [Micromonospora sp. LAH09]|uniref:hypothetical protein n=1 Tax=Micromonospora cabrerizensis TaxID=2911213 RepID=UPI001EE83BA8|nr:hypothetical protein [Micromonospora cabrerizensis]MCG5472070.1 hypothetical protein [Micromonospora cabrerizensis]
MTWSAVLLVTAVVWAVSVIRSVRLRALVYSLPLPMTLVLVSTDNDRVDGAQLLGVLGLNLFFVTVAVTHHRLRWPILLADAAGIAVYVALSAGLLAVVIPFEAALVGTLVLWLAAMLLLRRRARQRAAPAADRAATVETSDGGRPDGLPPLLKLVVIFVGAILTALLGTVLRGMVVTFPYSGVLVAVEARHQLREFSRHFARNSLALVGFLTAYHYLQDVSSAVALGAGWAAFAVVAAALHLPLRPRPAAPAPTTAAPTIAPPTGQPSSDRRPATPPVGDATPDGPARRPDPATSTGGGPAQAQRAVRVRPPRPLRPSAEPPSVR